MFAAGALLLAVPGASQNISVQSVQAPAPDLGKVVSATSGDTTFVVSASTGSVTKASGGGARVSTGSTRSLVTLACGGIGFCNVREVTVTISSIGSPSGRARSLTNFTVAEGTADIISGPTGTNPITFVIAPIGRDSTATFWVGADFPIAGDNSGLPTGAASSAFQVHASLTPLPFEGIGTGLAVATVFRPIVVGLTSNLSFGTVTRPREGNGSIVIDAQTGNRTVSGTGAEAINLPAPSRAAFSVSGEGGQVISVHVPATFTMTGPGGNLTVTTNHTAVGTQTLSSAIGSTGTYSFQVGGSFPTSSTTPVGAYTGSFTTMVQYN